MVIAAYFKILLLRFCYCGIF